MVLRCYGVQVLRNFFLYAHMMVLCGAAWVWRLHGVQGKGRGRGAGGGQGVGGVQEAGRCVVGWVPSRGRDAGDGVRETPPLYAEKDGGTRGARSGGWRGGGWICRGGVSYARTMAAGGRKAGRRGKRVYSYLYR